MYTYIYYRCFFFLDDKNSLWTISIFWKVNMKVASFLSSPLNAICLILYLSVTSEAKHEYGGGPSSSQNGAPPKKSNPHSPSNYNKMNPVPMKGQPSYPYSSAGQLSTSYKSSHSKNQYPYHKSLSYNKNSQIQSIHRENYSWDDWEEDLDEWAEDIDNWWDSVEAEYEEMYEYVKDWYGDGYSYGDDDNDGDENESESDKVENAESIETMEEKGEEKVVEESTKSYNVAGDGSYAQKWYNSLPENEKNYYSNKYEGYVEKYQAGYKHHDKSYTVNHYIEGYKTLALDASKASGGNYVSLDTIQLSEEAKGYQELEGAKLFTVETFSKKLEEDVQNIKKYYQLEWSKLSVQEQEEIKAEYEDYIAYYNANKDEIHKAIDEVKAHYKEEYAALSEEQKELIDQRFAELQYYYTLTDSGSEGYGQGEIWTESYGLLHCRDVAFWGQCSREEIAGLCDRSCYSHSGYIDSKGNIVDDVNVDESWTTVVYYSSSEIYESAEDMYANYEMEMQNVIQHYKEVYNTMYPDASLEDITNDFGELAEYTLEGTHQYKTEDEDDDEDEDGDDDDEEDEEDNASLVSLEGEPVPLISPSEAQLKEIMRYYSEVYGNNPQVSVEELYAKWENEQEEQLLAKQQEFKKELKTQQDEILKKANAAKQIYQEEADIVNSSLQTLGGASNPYEEICRDKPNTAFVRVKVGTVLVGSSCLIQGRATPYVTLRMDTHESKTNVASRNPANWDQTFNLNCQTPGRRLYANLYNKLNNKLCASWVIDDWDNGNERKLSGIVTSAPGQAPTGTGIIQRPDVMIGDVITFDDDKEQRESFQIESQPESGGADISSSYRLTNYGINNKYVNVDQDRSGTKTSTLSSTAKDTSTLTLDIMVYGTENFEEEYLDDQYDSTIQKKTEEAETIIGLLIFFLISICLTTLCCQCYQRKRKLNKSQKNHQQHIGVDIEDGTPSAPNLPIAVPSQSPRWMEYFGEILTARPTSPNNGEQNFSGQHIVHAQSVHIQQQAKF